MKQDLEKTETVFLSSASTSRKSSAILAARMQFLEMQVVINGTRKRTGYRIWLRDENKLIETIHVRFDENTKGVDASQNSNQYTKFNFTIANYSDDEGDFDTVMDSLSGRLIPETSSESPSTSREEPSASTDSSLIQCSEIKWIRKIGREITGAGISYGIEGKATRLKSFNEIERYCREHKIHFDKNLFDFSGENTKSEKLTDSA
ncbi:hypothetical protein AVEN_242511-1 [Araneus ventricosus]|uniref:Retroviral polymerase SH3-like domain-containing protein n=1 Tax=Araneus ventricosus TaxID=182803 RepID=A0A4Y2VWN5_ARAVE|nr:hypothetical protein AVEN_242511-1 [Araneus ventricosus]